MLRDLARLHVYKRVRVVCLLESPRDALRAGVGQTRRHLWCTLVVSESVSSPPNVNALCILSGVTKIAEIAAWGAVLLHQID